MFFVKKERSYLVIKAKEVRIVKEVMTSDGLWPFACACGDVLGWASLRGQTCKPLLAPATLQILHCQSSRCCKKVFYRWRLVVIKNWFKNTIAIIFNVNASHQFLGYHHPRHDYPGEDEHGAPGELANPGRRWKCCSRQRSSSAFV